MPAASLLRKNIDHAIQVFESLRDLENQVEQAAALMLQALTNGRKLLACGNGGSAADASHLTTEFVVRFNQDRRPYPAISLGANGGDLTAIGNDYQFADIFARQVDAFGQPGDVLVALSTSGRSENVRRALEAAAARRVHTIALLGRDGGNTRGLADVELIVPGDDTARIQEAHKLLIHTLCERIEQDLPRE